MYNIRANLDKKKIIFAHYIKIFYIKNKSKKKLCINLNN